MLDISDDICGVDIRYAHIALHFNTPTYSLPPTIGPRPNPLKISAVFCVMGAGDYCVDTSAKGFREFCFMKRRPKITVLPISLSRVSTNFVLKTRGRTLIKIK